MSVCPYEHIHVFFKTPFWSFLHLFFSSIASRGGSGICFSSWRSYQAFLWKMLVFKGNSCGPWLAFHALKTEHRQPLRSQFSPPCRPCLSENRHPVPWKCSSSELSSITSNSPVALHVSLAAFCLSKIPLAATHNEPRPQISFFSSSLTCLCFWVTVQMYLVDIGRIPMKPGFASFKPPN
jgi:hypothetical protein